MNGSRDRTTWRLGIGVALLVAQGMVPASAQHHGGGSHMGGGFASLGPGHDGPPYAMNGFGPWGGGVAPFGASPFVVGLGGVFLPVFYAPPPPPMMMMMPAEPVGGGLMLPNPPMPGPGAMPVARPVVRGMPKEADRYVARGDNLFRAGNRHRAEQRYLQAVRANSQSAAPHVRLAQLALVRGDYAEAAEEFRSATAAEPGWLLNATDIQRLFAEPGDFAEAVAKLESHLQQAPTDRDGWLVLGAEWYLSGRTRQAADVFTRLNDREPDATLTSFLDATTPEAIAGAPR